MRNKKRDKVIGDQKQETIYDVIILIINVSLNKHVTT